MAVGGRGVASVRLADAVTFLRSGAAGVPLRLVGALLRRLSNVRAKDLAISLRPSVLSCLSPWRVLGFHFSYIPVPICGFDFNKELV